MSESNQTPAVQRGLLETDDPMVWAEEFVRIFAGKVVGEEPLDVGTMITWFANAMQTALDIKERRDEIGRKEAPIGMVPEAQRDAFVEGFEDGREEQPDAENDPKA